MTAGVEQQPSVLDALVSAAEDFAARARVQEACRDRARPGTAVHQRHAHSATLWRQAEGSIRIRIADLQLESGM